MLKTYYLTMLFGPVFDSQSTLVQQQQPQPTGQAPDAGVMDLRKRIFTPEGKFKDPAKGNVGGGGGL